MGTEAREELKAKQLEKVIYFAANLVTWVDEDKRHQDLPNLEAELRRGDRRDRAAAGPRRRPPVQGPRGRAARAGDRGRQGLRDQGPPAAPSRRRSPRLRERYQEEAELAQRAFDEFRSLHARKIIEDELLWRELRVRYEDYFEGGMGAEAIPG